VSDSAVNAFEGFKDVELVICIYIV